MAVLDAEFRLLRLELAIRFRRFGLWPWVMLTGWSLFAAGQEPRLLRSFDVHVSWQGTWSGAAILLVALACTGRGQIGSGPTGSSPYQLRSNARRESLVGLSLAVAVGVSQAVLAWVAEAVTGPMAPASMALRSAAGFTVAMAPTSIACAVLLPLWRSSFTARFGLLLAGCFSLGVSAVCFSDLTVTTVAASALAAAFATCAGLVIASSASLTSTPAANANRHSR